MNIQNKIDFSFLKKLWWLYLFICIFETLFILIIFIKFPNNREYIVKNYEEVITKSDVSKCPENLSGILTYPFMKPEDISSIIPLGNINPPGHTSPVDHNYIDSNSDEDVSLYAPADSIITKITQISYKEDGSNEYKVAGYALTFSICDGLELDLTEYQVLSEKIKTKLQLEKPDCVEGIKKDGHSGQERQCHFQTAIAVKSGELLGTVKRVNDKFPFEIWAANYNVKPREDVNWNFYNDDRYAHIMCLFDLYSGDLKDQYYAKFGSIRNGSFIPRTIEPLCGQVNQNIVGTIQGMWYYGNEDEKNIESQGKGLAFLHDNIDPTIGEISIGGTVHENAEVVFFNPKHTGLIDREPSEVTADGNIYCYIGRDENEKYIVQLIDDTHMKIEFQNGTCNSNESFINPYTYQR